VVIIGIMKKNKSYLFKYFLQILCALYTINTFNSCTSDKANILAPEITSANCDTVKYTYNANVKNIVYSNCIGCHNTGSANGDLSNHTNLKAYALSGSLIGSIKGQGYTQMPPAGKLSDCDIKGIENWVIAGANDD